MNDTLDFEAACRIARAERQSVAFIRRVLTGVDDSPEARRIRALSAEAIARAPACRRIRTVNPRPRNFGISGSGRSGGMPSPGERGNNAELIDAQRTLGGRT